ncbi:hypothetical protein ACIBL6_03680 [Streptomyces sp. NPDC050400]|uniref:hypothetical protein n=1 Tax=Streptomyces sp. NPDC050400 TaxID=3365610 RepID=UPI0037A28ADB
MTDIGRARQDGQDRTVPGPGTDGEPGHEPGHEQGAVKGARAVDPIATERGAKELRPERPERDPAEPGGKPMRMSGAGDSARAELVPHDTRDELSGRLRHAVTGFVDEPRAAVEEADHVLEDLTARLAETLAGRRRTLRTSWQDATEDTEQLRLALRDYRETAEKLLRL